MIEKIVKYFSLFSLGIFILGYAFLNGYYSSFHIDITKYISTSEIFYVLLPFVSLILSTGYAFFQGYTTPIPKKKPLEAESTLTPKKKWYSSIWVNILLCVLFSIGAFVNITHFSYREAPFIQMICDVGILFSAAFFVLKGKLKASMSNPFIQLAGFIFIGYLFIQFGQYTARINKLLGNSTKIKFNYHSKLYSSNDRLILLGETQSTIFLYNKLDSCTWVLPRANLDSLIILDK